MTQRMLRTDTGGIHATITHDLDGLNEIKLNSLQVMFLRMTYLITLTPSLIMHLKGTQGQMQMYSSA